jgi:hypothetical protein
MIRFKRLGAGIAVLLLATVAASCTSTTEQLPPGTTGPDPTASSSETTSGPDPAASSSETVSGLFLSARPGDPPDVTHAVPHIQLTQTSPDAIVTQLVAGVYAIPNVSEAGSNSSLPGAQALLVASGVPARRGAMITGREFGHIHAAPNGGGSLHLRLPLETAQLVVDTGWGIYHPFALDGSVPGFVMVFSPRSETDLVSVLAIVEEAATYAMTPGEDPLTERPNILGG